MALLATTADAPAATKRRTLVAVGAWATVVVVALAWGIMAVAGARVGVAAAPLVGRWTWHGGRGLLPAVVVAAAGVVFGPRVARSWSWPALLAGSGAAAAVWTLALAASDGVARVAAPLDGRHELLQVVDRIGSPAAFLDGFVAQAPGYPIHVKGHPPGAPLVLWALDRVGLAGPGWAAVLVLLAVAVTTVAVLVAARDVAGEGAARRTAPFLALLPAAVWAGTSPDPIYGAVFAVGAALVVRSSATLDLRTAAAGGAVLALALHLTYGAVVLLLIPAAVVVTRRAWEMVAPAVVGAASVTVLFTIAGFWWFDGLALTKELYEAGVAGRRSAVYFAVAGNPGALALAAGPAVAVGLAVVRGHRIAVLVGVTAVAVLAADLSGMSRGEVERIWLPFVPWLALGTAALVRPQRWLVGQAALAVVLQASLRTPW